MRSAFPGALLVLLAVSASASASAAPLTREGAVRQALETSPRLIDPRAELARAKVELEAAGRAVQTNPVVSASAGPRLGSEFIDFNVGVSQEIAFFSRGSRVAAGLAGVKAAEARLESRRIEVAYEVREAFGRAVAAAQAAAVAEQAMKLAVDAVQIAEERLAAGAVSRLEANSARVEVGRTARERALRFQARENALAALRLAVGLSPGAALELPESLPTSIARPEGSPDALLQLAAVKRPDLIAARERLEAALAEERVAARAAIPNPTFGVSYAQDEGASIVQGTLSFPLPLFERNQVGRGQASAEVARAREELEALERAIRMEVTLAHSRFEAAEASAKIFAEDVLAALEENLGLAAEAWREGKLTFPELLMLRRETLEARSGAIETFEELNEAEAHLMRVLASGS